MSDSPEDHDDAVELPERRVPDDPGEGAVATAVRRALLDDPSWTTERFHQVVRAAEHRAAQRRRRRQVRTSALLLAGAAAATALLLALSPVLGPSRPDTGLPAAGPDLEEPWASATRAGLTPAEVQAVIPLARPVGYGPDPAAEPQVPLDACGSSPLVGAVAPLASDSGEWGDTTTRQVIDAAGGSGTETSSDILLEITVDTYADATQAEAYTAALNASAGSCVPGSSDPAAAPSLLLQGSIAPVLFASTAQDGVLRVVAARVDGRTVATARAWVPVAAATPTSASGQPGDETAGANTQELADTVLAIVGLSATAAQRAAP